MDLCFTKLENPFITPKKERRDEDERPSKGRVVEFYSVSQGWSLGFESREELSAQEG